MLHSIVLAGVETQSAEIRAELPLFFEQEQGIASRFREVLRSVSGDLFEAPIVVTGQSASGVAAEQMKQEGTRGALLLEPGAHNPAAAILSGLMRLRDKPDALVVIAPAVADLGTPEILDRALCHAIPAAQRGEVVVMSERTAQSGRSTATLEVAKPPVANMPAPVTRVGKAGMSFFDGFLQRGHVVWSTGVIVARVDVLMAAYKRFASRMFLAVKHALSNACHVMDGLLLDGAAYDQVKSRQFETFLGHRLAHLTTIPLHKPIAIEDQWDADLAEDQALPRGMSHSRPAPTLHAARVLEALKDIADNAVEQATVQEFDWGQRELLAEAQDLSVSRVTINPGAVVDLKEGCQEDQHWIVQQGAALVTMGAGVKFVAETQSTRVPGGSKTRIENPGQTPLVVVQMHVGAKAVIPVPVGHTATSFGLH